MSDVFISYSRRDKVFARRIFEALDPQKREIWVDWEGIPYSTDWWKEISAGIEGADTFIFIITPDSLASKVCNEELAYAYKLNKRIIPVVRREINEREIAGAWFDKDWESQARENWKILKKINWLLFRRKDDCDCKYDEKNEVINPECDGEDCDYDNFTNTFDALTNIVETDLEHVKAHTRLLIRAVEWEKNDRNASFLLRGDDLRTAEQWLQAAAGKDQKPDELHTAYILASRTSENRRQQRLLVGVSIAAVLLLVAAVVAIVAFQASERNLNTANLNATEIVNQAATALARSTEVAQERDRANTGATRVAQERDRAEGLRLASEGNSLLQNETGNRETAALLAVQALNVNPNDQARSVLDRALSQIDRSVIVRGAAYSQALTWTPDGSAILYDKNDLAPGHEMQLVDAVTGDVRVRFRGHSAGLNATAFSHNGRYLVTSHTDYGVYLWEIETGTLHHALEGEFENLIYGLQFLPDDSAVLVSDLNGNVRLWDVETGRQRTAYKLNGLIFNLDITPDGQLFVASNLSGSARIFDIFTGETTGQTFDGPNVLAVRFDKNAQTLFTTHPDDGDIIQWDVATGERLRTLSGHNFSVFSLAVSPDGRHLASASYDAFSNIATPLADTAIRIWDIETGSMKTTLDTEMIWNLQFTLDQSSLLGVSDEGSIFRRWPLEESAVLSDTQTIATGEGLLFSLDIAPHQQMVVSEVQLKLPSMSLGDLAAGSVPEFSQEMIEKNRIVARNTVTGAEVWRYQVNVLPTLVKNVRYVDANIVIGYSDFSDAKPARVAVWVWDAQTGKERFAKIWADASGIIVSSDHRYFAVIYAQERVEIYDVLTGELKFQIETPQIEPDVVFSPDGYTVAIYWDRIEENTPHILIWDLVAEKQRYAIASFNRTIQLKFSPDGRFYVVASDFRLAVHETANVTSSNPTGLLFEHFPPDLSGKIVDFAFMPKESSLLIGYAQHPTVVMELLSLPLGDVVQTFNMSFRDSGTIYVAPNGDTVINGGLWDVNTGNFISPISGSPDYQSMMMYSLDLKNDGDVFAASHDSFFTLGENNWYIWDVRSGKVLKQLSAANLYNTIQLASYAPDGQKLYTAETGIVLGNPLKLEWQIRSTITGYQSWKELACRSVQRELTSEQRRFYLLNADNPTCSYGHTLIKPADIVNRLAVDAVIERPSGALRERKPELRIDLADQEGSIFWRLFNESPSDFVFGATLEWGTSPTQDYCGVVFDLTDNANFKVFFFGQNGQLGQNRMVDGQFTHFSPSSYEVKINTGIGARNQLVVVSEGGMTRLYINGQYAVGSGLTEGDDPDLPLKMGLVGAAVAGDEDSACIYHDVWLWDLDAAEPMPTPMPTATLSAPRLVAAGSNAGTLALGGRDVWVYDGQQGQRITIEIVAEHPANDASDEIRRANSLLDPELIVRTTDGRILKTFSDIDAGKITDIKLEELELPYTGRYELEIYCWENQAGGNYTLTVYP